MRRTTQAVRPAVSITEPLIPTIRRVGAQLSAGQASYTQRVLPTDPSAQPEFLHGCATTTTHGSAADRVFLARRGAGILVRRAHRTGPGTPTVNLGAGHIRNVAAALRSASPGSESEQRLAADGGAARAPAWWPGGRGGLERSLDGVGDKLRGLRVDGDVPAEQHAADDLPGVPG